MDDLGWPLDGFAGEDPDGLLADPYEAAALDHDEPGQVRVGVWLDDRLPGERQLGDRAAAVGVDHCRLDAAAAGRPLGSAVPEAEPPDLDAAVHVAT